MIVIGERVNVISKSIGAAMRERDPGPIIEMAKRQQETGSGMLDINIGPATKDGPALMEWLVTTIQAEVDISLCLDTTNAEAMEAGLKAHRGRALINSASGEADKETGEQKRLHSMMSLAKKHDAMIIGLALTAGIPRNADERCVVAADLIAAAMEYGISTGDLFLDPLVVPIAIQQPQVQEVITAIQMFKQMADPAPKTVVGLTNISNGAPPKTAEILNSTLLAVLIDNGLDSAIADSSDKMLMTAANDAAGWLARADSNSSDPLDVAIARTLACFKNEVLYSHSYLNDLEL